MRGGWVLAATILGSSLAFIDGTIVNVALPALQRGLGADVADVQWVIVSYTLFLSALLLVGGTLGDRYGRRRVFAAGVVVFAAASAACGLACDVRTLIVARSIQGVGAALLVPGSLALIAASFPERERGRAFGTWSAFSAMTTAIGPVLGGWLIDRLSWRWAFFVNLPLALVTLALLYRHVPESRDPDAPRQLDWPGAAFATVGLGGVVYGMIAAGARGWSHPGVVTPIAGGFACLLAFLIREARSRTPMVPLSLFRSVPFTGANLLTLGLYAALSVAFFVLPLNLIQVQGYSAAEAGAALLPFIVLLTLLSRWSGGLLDRFGARLPLTAGPVLAALGLALLALPGVDGRYLTGFLPALAVFGLGMAITVAPLTATVMNAVDVGHAGLASGVNNAVSRVAGLLAIAVVSVPLLLVFGSRMEERLDALDLEPEMKTQIERQLPMMAAMEVPPAAAPPVRAAIERAVRESFVAAYRLVVLLSAGLALLSAAVAAVTLGGRPAAAQRAGPSP